MSHFYRSRSPSIYQARSRSVSPDRSHVPEPIIIQPNPPAPVGIPYLGSPIIVQPLDSPRSSSRSRSPHYRNSRRRSDIRLSPLLPDDDEPPSPLDPDTIQLDSITDSKITSVSVYSARAEVTRVFSVKVKAGLNRLLVRGLPSVLEQDSVRVEGHGAATIHDVALGHVPPPSFRASSEAIQDLYLAKQRIQMALERTKLTKCAFETYPPSANTQHLDTARLSDIVQTYQSAALDLDDKIIELETQRNDIERQIKAEKARLKATQRESYNERLCGKASISVFAEVEGEISITLIYAVSNASWNAGYDIRVDMQHTRKPIQLFYQGVITQNTGEEWNGVPLTLETASPTFGLSVITLERWTLSVKKPPAQKVYESRSRSFERRSTMTGFGPMPGVPMIGVPMTGVPIPYMTYRGTDISSKGTINATFSVPGLISIPSDGQSHNVNITTLLLENTMSWMCVPKKDSKVHLKAKIKNASDYTLLSGIANVYLDGSFISKTKVPLVSPDETFDCPLGLDPSIRVTYHPRTKKISKSGFYTRSTNYVYRQRITIFNTKTQAIDGLKVLDQFPISEDSTIVVKHINPALVVPSSESTSTGSGASASNSSLKLKVKGITPVKVSQGVVAQWDGADEIEGENAFIDSIGKDGKLAWICSIPPGTKLDLVLHWEVTTPVRTEVDGL